MTLFFDKKPVDLKRIKESEALFFKNNILEKVQLMSCPYLIILHILLP